jgi:hypothetical protein
MNQTMIRNGFVLALALLFAGCAGLRSPIVPAPGLAGGELEQRQVSEMISYAQRVAAMSAEQQRREYSASNQAFAKDKDAMSRMRLALLIATPAAAVQDAARAATLLEPMATQGDAASPLRAFARLLYAQLNERAIEQKRTNQLRDKLEALKEVERAIMERGQESQPRRR